MLFTATASVHTHKFNKKYVLSAFVSRLHSFQYCSVLSILVSLSVTWNVQCKIFGEEPMEINHNPTSI